MQNVHITRKGRQFSYAKDGTVITFDPDTMMDVGERLFMDGERAKNYIPYHVASGDWHDVTTPLEIIPATDKVNVITRFGFTIYNPNLGVTGNPMKMEFFNGSEWILLQEADCFGCLLCVASRVDYGSLTGGQYSNISWHYKNAIRIAGAKGEKLKIYPTGLVTWCAGIFCGVRYLEYVESG